jgi:integrase
MARTIRDAKLDSRSARSRLLQRREPYWRSISSGLAVGIRKGANGGTWIARHYSAEHGRRYCALGTADDIADADGLHVLDFDQAQERARAWFKSLAGQDHGGPIGRLTVAVAMDQYLEYLEKDGRSQEAIKDARYRDLAFIREPLGKLQVDALTADQLRQWRDKLAKAPPRLRTKSGNPQKHKAVRDDEGSVRARRASANRTFSTLRAALNHAFKEKRVTHADEWRRVTPFKNVDAARVRYLSIAEAKRLLEGCDPEFRPLVEAALLTGARYSELARLTVVDFDARAGTVAVRKSKSGKPRHVVLSAEGIAYFKRATAGRAGNEPIFVKKGGNAWLKSHQNRPMAAACERAKIKPAISFHGLRHTWASHAVMNGAPLFVVAKNLGHSDTRMVEKHYGHLAPSYVADAIRAAAPRFGIKPIRKPAVARQSETAI